MSRVNASRHQRLLRLQGWDEPELRQALDAGPWVRWSPGLCFVMTVLGTAVASAPLLGALALTALFGALLPFHPFDLAYNHGIRHLVKRPALPANRAARRSACALAAPWLGVTALAFASEATTAGYAVGAALGAAGAVFTFAGLCIPSLLFNLLFGRERACRRSLLAAAIGR